MSTTPDTSKLDAALARPEQTIEVSPDGTRRTTYKDTGNILKARDALKSSAPRRIRKSMLATGSKGW